MPSNTLARTIQPHAGANISKNGTGIANSQPATSSGLRPVRSAVRPAYRFASALVKPNVTMNESTAVSDTSPNTRCPTSGSTSRSIPTMEPTKALTATSSQNCVALGARPRRTVRFVSAGTRNVATCGDPFRGSERKPCRVEAALAQQGDHLVGEYAVRTPAVDHIAFRSRQGDLTGSESVERRADRTWKVRSFVLLARAGIEQCRTRVRERVPCRGDGGYARFARTEVRSLGVRDGRVCAFSDS